MQSLYMYRLPRPKVHFAMLCIRGRTSPSAPGHVPARRGGERDGLRKSRRLCFSIKTRLGRTMRFAIVTIASSRLCQLVSALHRATILIAHAVSMISVHLHKLLPN